MKFYNLKEDKEYGYKHQLGSKSEQCTYSFKTVDFIVQKIHENPDSIIDDLKAAIKRERG